MTNYYAAAKTLDELMLELIKNGMAIPSHVADDLKSGRSLTSIEQRQDCDVGIANKINTILERVEMNLLSLAESGVGAEYADEWQKRIAGAYCVEPVKAPPASKMVFGVPKGKHWVRVQKTELEAVKELDALIGEYTLTALMQEDGYMLVYGEKEDVCAFLKAIRQIIGKNGESIRKK